MIWFIAVALHATPPEKFFCDHAKSLQECIRLTRRWICSPEDVGDEDQTVPLYAQTVREERRLVCHKRRR